MVVHRAVRGYAEILDWDAAEESRAALDTAEAGVKGGCVLIRATRCLITGVACGGAVIPLACLLFWRKATGLAACLGEDTTRLL